MLLQEQKQKWLPSLLWDGHDNEGKEMLLTNICCPKIHNYTSDRICLILKTKIVRE